MISAGAILDALHEGARDFLFPMLDNGYVYPAAARLSLHRSADDWGIVFETFGYSPRACIPELLVTTFSNRPRRCRTAASFNSDDAWQAYLRLHAHCEQVFLYPVENDDWIDPDDCETIVPGRPLVLRGRSIALPPEADYLAAGIAPRVAARPVFETTRALALAARGAALATQEERRMSLPDGVEQVLVLDDWHHPDVSDPDALPSGTQTFRQLAKVLETGDVGLYSTGEPPNTHWSNWPEGGTL